MILEALDDALDQMAHGVDVEHCALRPDVCREAMRPMLQAAHGLFTLASEFESICRKSHSIKEPDWTRLLASA